MENRNSTATDNKYVQQKKNIDKSEKITFFLFIHPLFNFQLYLQDPQILQKWKAYYLLSFKTIF